MAQAWARPMDDSKSRPAYTALSRITHQSDLNIFPVPGGAAKPQHPRPAVGHVSSVTSQPWHRGPIHYHRASSPGPVRLPWRVGFHGDAVPIRLPCKSTDQQKEIESPSQSVQRDARLLSRTWRCAPLPPRTGHKRSQPSASCCGHLRRLVRRRRSRQKGFPLEGSVDTALLLEPADAKAKARPSPRHTHPLGGLESSRFGIQQDGFITVTHCTTPVIGCASHVSLAGTTAAVLSRQCEAQG